MKGPQIIKVGFGTDEKEVTSYEVLPGDGGENEVIALGSPASQNHDRQKATKPQKEIKKEMNVASREQERPEFAAEAPFFVAPFLHSPICPSMKW